MIACRWLALVCCPLFVACTTGEGGIETASPTPAAPAGAGPLPAPGDAAPPDVAVPDPAPPELAAPSPAGSGVASVTAALVERAHGASTPSFGPLLGRHPRRLRPAAGSYGVELRARQHRFVTMEHTESRSIHGGATLQLDDDGGARACWWATITDRGAIGRFATADGEDHFHESTQRFRVGARGRWSSDPATTTAHVVLDVFEHGNCEVGPHAVAVPPAVELDCVSVKAPTLPRAALACAIVAERVEPTRVAMLLWPSPRAGAWDLRHDLAMRDHVALPPEALPWLLLGTGPGLAIHHDDAREGEPITVELESAEVHAPVGPLPPAP